MQERHNENYSKLSQRARLLASADNADLAKFFSNCNKIWVELDNEMIECRKRNKVTAKYASLEAKLNEALNTFDQWAVFGALIR